MDLASIPGKTDASSKDSGPTGSSMVMEFTEKQTEKNDVAAGKKVSA